MKNEKIIEMLHDGKIEELEKILQNEIYTNSLKNNGTAAKRYKAMERYFKNTKDTREGMKKPCRNVSVHGNTYNSFIDGYCIALTTEDIGNIEEYDNTDNTYFKVEKMIDFSNVAETKNINVSDILALAKSKGYRYKKSEYDILGNFEYVLKVNDTYVKIGLLDKAFSIIDDGNNAEWYYTSSKSPIILKNDIGIALVLPFYNNDGKIEERKTVINIDDIKTAWLQRCFLIKKNYIL